MSLRPLVAIATLAAGIGRAEGADLNVVTAVELADEGATVVLSVKGSKAPNFTTFSMADPPRFVIDLSEAKFQGVPEDLKVDDGTILLVKNLSYGSDATSIARVMIAFVNDVEPPDVQAQGSTLVVRVTKPGAPAVARKDEAQPPLAAAAAAAAKARADAEAQAKTDAERRAREEAQAKADAERRAQE
jgi:colicin import membrane protein